MAAVNRVSMTVPVTIKHEKCLGLALDYQ